MSGGGCLQRAGSERFELLAKLAEAFHDHEWHVGVVRGDSDEGGRGLFGCMKRFHKFDFREEGGASGEEGREDTLEVEERRVDVEVLENRLQFFVCELDVDEFESAPDGKRGVAFPEIFKCVELSYDRWFCFGAADGNPCQSAVILSGKVTDVLICGAVGAFDVTDASSLCVFVVGGGGVYVAAVVAARAVLCEAKEEEDAEIDGGRFFVERASFQCVETKMKLDELGVIL